MQIFRSRPKVESKIPNQRLAPNAHVIRNSITDDAVLSPDFTEKLKELVVIMRPFVHWYVVATPLSQIQLIGLLARSGSLNDMMTIQDTDGDSSQSEGDDEDTGEDEDV